jgi:hypothetical protein
MLEAKSIKTMYKPYTLKQMVENAGRVKYDQKMWGNGQIVFVAPLPEKAGKYGVAPDLAIRFNERMQEYVDACTIESYPIMMGHVVADNVPEKLSALSLVMFQNETGRFYFDARYVVNLIVSAKSRAKSKTLTWQMDTKRRFIKLVENDKVIGILGGLDIDKDLEHYLADAGNFEWRVVNPDMDTPYLTPEEEQAYVESKVITDESEHNHLAFFVNALHVVAPNIKLLRASDLFRFFDVLDNQKVKGPYDLVQDGYTWLINNQHVTDKIKERLPQALQEYLEQEEQAHIEHEANKVITDVKTEIILDDEGLIDDVHVDIIAKTPEEIAADYSNEQAKGYEVPLETIEKDIAMEIEIEQEQAFVDSLVENDNGTFSPPKETIVIENPINGQTSQATVEDDGTVVIEDAAFFEPIVEGKTLPQMIETILEKEDDILAKIDAYHVEEHTQAVETREAITVEQASELLQGDDDAFDVDGSEYAKAIKDARKVKITDEVIGGLVTETGLVTIENVSKSKRAYAPNLDALDAVCETLPEDAFYLGLWCTTTNKSPGKTHLELAQQVWDDEGPGILVVTENKIYGLGKIDETKDKIVVVFETPR